MGQNWTFLLFIGVLLSCSSCENWMGAGNWTSDNLTSLRRVISTFNAQASTSTYLPFANGLSLSLNDEWAPAWNVVVAFDIDGGNYDAVLYGYGFRGHWFWLNGYQVDAGFLTFIIWKDYNCVQWFNLNPGSFGYSTSSFNTSMTTLIRNKIMDANQNFPRDLNKIWKVAQDIQDKVQTADPALLQDKDAYTVIASQALNTAFFGYVCAKDYITANYIGNFAGATSGAALILQMRGPLIPL